MNPTLRTLAMFTIALALASSPQARALSIAETGAERDAAREAAETLTALLKTLADNPAFAPHLSGLFKEAERGLREGLRELARSGKGGKRREGAKRGRGTPEENDRFVADLYRRILKREPDPGGRKNWNDELNSGRMSRADVERAFLASDEYRHRFGGGAPGAKGNPPDDGGADRGGEAGAPGSGAPTGSGTLDDLFGDGAATGGDPGGAVTEAGGVREARHVNFGARERGAIEFETSGITHQDKPCVNGDWEYIFLTVNGEGMNRFLLLHAGGNGRAVRYVLQGGGTDTMRMEVASDDLPGWHRWRVEWGGGQLKVFLDGRQIGRTETFAGAKPASCIVGGNQNSRRNFLGTWRNFKVE